MKKRKLLLDSCMAGAVARRLRAEGHDVITVAERGADPGDAAILALAVSEGRALVTIDTDFGMLVFRDGAKHIGVLRLRDNTPRALADRASQIVRSHGDDLEAGAFVTDDADRVRVTKPMSVRLHYDAATNAAYLRLSAEAVVESEEVAAGIVLDYDAQGRMVGMEVLRARDRLPADALVAGE